MDQVNSVLSSSNGVPIAIIGVIAIVLLLVLGKLGFFNFNAKGLKIGRTESEVRAILLKQKEFLLQYCSYLTQTIISDLSKKGIRVEYVTTDYVVEKVVDEWLGWLLVNHITEDEDYVHLKTMQAKLIMMKAIGRVNSQLLQSEELETYFEEICARSTKEIIKGVLNVYKMETK